MSKEETATRTFNEQSLRKAIADKWGEYGAHMEVFDSLLKDSRVLGLLKTGNYISPEKLNQAEEIISNLNP